MKNGVQKLVAVVCGNGLERILEVAAHALSRTLDRRDHFLLRLVF
jgi:hypothetical protein